MPFCCFGDIVCLEICLEQPDKKASKWKPGDRPPYWPCILSVEDLVHAAAVDTGMSQRVVSAEESKPCAWADMYRCPLCIVRFNQVKKD